MTILILLALAAESIPFPSGGLEGPALHAHIQQSIDTNGGTPLVVDGVFHFFCKAAPDETPGIVGDFNFWMRRQKEKATPMTAMGGDWYHYGVKAQPKARMEYQLRIGEWQTTDPLNPLSDTSWSGKVSVARMPDFPTHPELTQRHHIAGGTLSTFVFKSEHRRNERDVHIYTPAGYEASEDRYPVLYFGDGTLFVNVGEIPKILDNLIADKVIPPVIAVFIDPVDRWLEYRMFTLYRGMILEELIPNLQQRLRLDGQKQVLIGSSRGGMSVLDLALTHPGRFMGCIAIAPAVTETDFMAVLRRMEVDRRPRFSIMAGTYDFWLSGGREIAAVMKEKGYQVTYREEPIGHSVKAWRLFLDDLLPPMFE